MLYIFHVETGAILTFDIKWALQSVEDLQLEIERKCGILATHQVLLMNGGECLQPQARVCSYSAGTDTNPIYLFSKGVIQSQVPPSPHTEYTCDADFSKIRVRRYRDIPDINLLERINISLNMPANYRTVVTRAELAQHCYELAREQTNACDHMVHDQHFQHQGWAAVVANLEDITQVIKARAENIQQYFTGYLRDRPRNIELLKTFDPDLDTLAKIPILPALRAHARVLLSSNSRSVDPLQQQVAECTSDNILSLLRWIAARDHRCSLDQIAVYCSQGLHQFDERVVSAILNEASLTIDAANKPEMKEIKGLGERLSALENLMNQAKRLVQEQGELAQGFLQNQARASNLGDTSVLPDLCASHRHQLVVMMENHTQLRDIRRRCAKAKEELSTNIYHRLKWIMYVECKILEVDKKLAMYSESLKRLTKYLNLVHQIHLTPQMYMDAVGEVVRRRTFSQAFLVWASNLACQLLNVHNEEIARRREFQTKFGRHFLYTLFTGLEDIPPAYATKPPAIFDSGLPELTVDDMENLKDQLPADIADSLSTPDLNTITQFFLSKSLSDGSTDGIKEKDISMPVDMPIKEEPREQLPMIADRVGFESETDTEEFEKIGQGGGDSKLGSYDEAKQKIQKQLEENLGNTRSEVEGLRSTMQNVKITTSEAMTTLREELNVLREKVTEDKSNLKEISDRVRHALALHSQKCEDALREREQVLVGEHELKMADMKKLLESRDEEIREMYEAVGDVEGQLAERDFMINTMRQQLEEEQQEMRCLRTRFQEQLDEALEQAHIEKKNALKKINAARHAEIDTLNRNLAQSQETICKLKETLRNAEAEQERAVKEATDKLHMEYKAELDTIRTRCKMVAIATSTMERSPSDSSLEKIERPDVIERANHEAILAQTKEDMEAEKEVAIREAVEKRSSNLKLELDYQLHLAATRIENETDSHRMRESALVEECQQYQEIIRRFTEEEKNIRKVLNDKIESLDEERQRLENKMLVEQMVLTQREAQVQELEAERDELRQELNESRMKMCQSCPELEDDLQTLLSGVKDEIEVSESKKVRLEASSNPESLSRRMELVELDNIRLSTELRVLRETKESVEAKVEALEADKVRLEVELVKERSRRGVVLAHDFGNYCVTNVATMSDSGVKDMNSSVAVVSEASSQENASCSESGVSRNDNISYYRNLLGKYFRPLIDERHVSFTTCNPGDIVFVDWDPARSHYVVVQDSRTLYILNSECIDTIELSLRPDGTPKATHILSKVVDKQYCHAKKPENRYHVPQGTKFYRVRVKPLAFVT